MFTKNKSFSPGTVATLLSSSQSQLSLTQRSSVSCSHSILLSGYEVGLVAPSAPWQRGQRQADGVVWLSVFWDVGHSC